MSQPRAIVFYERLMPGGQLVNRLQDLNYQVIKADAATTLAAAAQREMPLLLLADLEAQGDICGAIAAIRRAPETAHLPVIAFAPDNSSARFAAAEKAGATLVVGESILAVRLPALLEQALRVE